MQKQSEAIVLRNYPIREADLLVTFFTREEGKLRGIARSAMKSKRRFSGSLEPLSHVLAYYDVKQGQELSRLDSCDVLQSPLTDPMDYPRLVALEYVGEALDQLLPDHEPHDDIFRLALAVLRRIRVDSIWMPLTYFDLWMVRLIGLLPDLESCLACGQDLAEEKAYFHPSSDGLMCVRHKAMASSEMSLESRNLAWEMFRQPVSEFAEEGSQSRKRGADLRKFLGQRIERHIEKKLVTNTMLRRLE